MSQEYRKDGFTISTDPARLDQTAIFEALSASYWANTRPREKVERSLKNSLCFGVYEDASGRQIGLTRVISDFATYAYVCDVYILEEFQGRGLGKWMMRTVINYPDLQGLRLWSLRTRDAHGLYQQVGFQELSKPEIWMEYRPADGQ